MTALRHCPINSQYPPAAVDKDGWCHEHGWKCSDFGLHLDDSADGRGSHYEE